MAGDKKGEDFSSFQIGGMPGFGPGARATSPAPAPAPSSASPTEGFDLTAPEEKRFPVLEDLIESDVETITAFAEKMGETCQQLDELIAKRSGRIKNEAQQARDAFEEVFGLIDYLLGVKAELMNQGGEQEGA